MATDIIILENDLPRPNLSHTGMVVEVMEVVEVIMEVAVDIIEENVKQTLIL